MKKLFSALLALLFLLAFALTACDSGGNNNVTLEILTDSEYLSNFQIIEVSVEPEGTAVEFSLKEPVNGIGIYAFTGQVTIAKSVATGTLFTVVAKAGKASAERQYKASQAVVITITNSSAQLADGDCVYATVSDPDLEVAFSLENPVTGITIDNDGKVSIEEAVEHGTKFTIVVAAGGVTVKKEFTASTLAPGVFYDNFSKGLQKDNWYISRQAWGGANDGGCIPENVNYTADGQLVITANGNYYSGNIVGMNSNGGKRTGGAIISKDIFGPGTFEVRMKMMPRVGACGAIWTFYYENDNTNHEIDFETPGSYQGEYSMENTLFTSWTGVGGSQHNTTYKKTPTPSNDGKWHTYRFVWSTNPKKVDWYIDDVLMHSTTANVPTYHARFWIGCWFPAAWCGVPNFETDYALIDWVKVTPGDTTGSSYGKANNYMMDGKVAIDAAYPKTPIAMPERNWVSNAGFEGDANAWNLTSGAEIVTEAANASTHSLKVVNGTSATQIIDGLYSGYELDFYAFAKASGGNGKITLQFLNYNETNLGSPVTINCNSVDFTKVLQSITAPSGSKKLKVTLSCDVGATAYFDTLSLKFKD